nr:immunoglobulin light chain junction region [Macaca mulatta]
CQTYNDSPYSF